MTKRSLGVAAVFLVGCAVGGVSSQLVVPRASAQQAATLTKWEYMCWTDDARMQDVTAMANKAGAQGWELVGYFAGGGAANACFKRPKM